MSCIITYKGNKYTQEQFKEYISHNKKEFSHIMASNKNVIDSFKRKMKGIDFVFSQSPELASIGSKVQYLQYLSTIFKTSKVKDIVRHDTDSIFDEFDIKYFGKNDPGDQGKGFYFTNLNNHITGVGGEFSKYVILNILNPFIIKSSAKVSTNPTNAYVFGRETENITYKIRIEGQIKRLRETLLKEEKKFTSKDSNALTEQELIAYRKQIAEHLDRYNKELKEKGNNLVYPDTTNNDSVINYGMDSDEVFEYVVRDKSQIHILGSKQDIEGFKEFVDQNDIKIKKFLIENEFDSSFFKNLYNNVKSLQGLEIKEIDIPTIKNKYEPDLYNVYHGTDAYEITKEGNLILNPSFNFNNKTQSISLTQVPAVAQDYMIRKDGNFIIKINNAALENNYTIESSDEIAINTNIPIIIKKGLFNIIEVERIDNKENINNISTKELLKKVLNLKDNINSTELNSELAENLLVPFTIVKREEQRNKIKSKFIKQLTDEQKSNILLLFMLNNMSLGYENITEGLNYIDITLFDNIEEYNNIIKDINQKKESFVNNLKFDINWFNDYFNKYSGEGVIAVSDILSILKVDSNILKKVQEKFNNISKSKLISYFENKIAFDNIINDNLQSDISNLNLTEEVLNYLYENSSKSKDFITFVKDLKKMIAIWQNSGRTNEEILEMIKCL
ncbi:MAG TPA: hypothetical protein PLV83_02020 [Bacilli bacterium]|nr:hypothetical protein [Bacilli bacterium]